MLQYKKIFQFWVTANTIYIYSIILELCTLFITCAQPCVNAIYIYIYIPLSCHMHAVPGQIGVKADAWQEKMNLPKDKYESLWLLNFENKPKPDPTLHMASRPENDIGLLS